MKPAGVGNQKIIGGGVNYTVALLPNSSTNTVWPMFSKPKNGVLNWAKV